MEVCCFLNVHKAIWTGCRNELGSVTPVVHVEMPRIWNSQLSNLECRVVGMAKAVSSSQNERKSPGSCKILELMHARRYRR